MAAFDLDTDLAGDVAFRLMSNSFVTLFWRSSVLQDTIQWLSHHGYQVIQLTASAWHTDADLHRDMAAALGFPSYYGHNLDALNDCLRDVVTYDYGALPDTAGLALVLVGYDTFAARRPRTAHVVLDILADRARSAALIGHRMLFLVQSNDSQVRFEPVGAMPVLWNPAEWLDAARRHPPTTTGIPLIAADGRSAG